MLSSSLLLRAAARSHHLKRSMVVVSQHKKGDPAAAVERQQETSSSQTTTTPPPNTALNDNVIVTDACWKRIERLNDNDAKFLRLYVDAGGCSGFEYVFELDTNVEEDDVVIQGPIDKARLVIDSDSLDLVKGSTIDYVTEMIKSSFQVKENPQSESACGCGSSFAVKNFSKFGAKD